MDDSDNDDNNNEDTVEVEIVPTITTLADLLEQAEVNKSGTLSIKGEFEDGSVQWGIVVVCHDEAAELMDALQVAVDASIARRIAARAN